MGSTGDANTCVPMVHNPHSASPIHAVPFIHVDEEGKFHVSDECVSFLEKVEAPIAVIGVAGLYRTGFLSEDIVCDSEGKSFLLNRLIEADEGFEVGPTVRPCTKGPPSSLGLDDAQAFGYGVLQNKLDERPLYSSIPKAPVRRRRTPITTLASFLSPSSSARTLSSTRKGTSTRAPSTSYRLSSLSTLTRQVGVKPDEAHPRQGPVRLLRR
jgi:hypothetical protein